MRTVLRWGITAMLTLVGGFAVFLLCFKLAKSEYTHHEIEAGCAAVAVLVITALYGAVHRRWQLHWLGVPAYLLSCYFVVNKLTAWINGVYKQFAPASDEEAAQAYWEGMLALGLMSAGSLAVWLVVAWLSCWDAERQAARIA